MENLIFDPIHWQCMLITQNKKRHKSINTAIILPDHILKLSETPQPNPSRDSESNRNPFSDRNPFSGDSNHSQDIPLDLFSDEKRELKSQDNSKVTAPVKASTIDNKPGKKKRKKPVANRNRIYGTSSEGDLMLEFEIPYIHKSTEQDIQALVNILFRDIVIASIKISDSIRFDRGPHTTTRIPSSTTIKRGNTNKDSLIISFTANSAEIEKTCLSATENLTNIESF
jgi:hypothetical protein